MGKNTIGLTIFCVTQIALLVLKLTGTINWSWWIVLIPTLVSVLFFIVAIAIMFVTLIEVINNQKEM